MPPDGLSQARAGERARRRNRTKVLLCYALCFALPLLWAAGSLLWIYPYKLMGTAPKALDALIDALPALRPFLSPYAALAADPAVDAPQWWAAALNARESQWKLCWLFAFGLGWLATLCIQLLWRFTHAGGCQAAKNTGRAIRDYRAGQTAIWLVNLALGATVWFFGARYISGASVWDALAYYAPFLLNPLAAMACYRLAAPPTLSGKRAFFKRL